METELTTFHEQMEKAKAYAVVEFRSSQPFIDACTIYYGNGFDDCLKQVGSVYPGLDLSKISIEDPLPTTPVGGDTVSEETDKSTHIEQDPKDDGAVLAQPALERLVSSMVPFAKDPLPKIQRTLLLRTSRIL